MTLVWSRAGVVEATPAPTLEATAPEGPATNCEGDLGPGLSTASPGESWFEQYEATELVSVGERMLRIGSLKKDGTGLLLQTYDASGRWLDGRVIPVEEARRSQRVAVASGSQLVTAATLWRSRMESDIEVVMLDTEGRVIWRTVLGASSPYDGAPAIAISSKGVVVVWIAGVLGSSSSLRSAVLDPATGRSSTERTLTSGGGWFLWRPKLVATQANLVMAWSVSSPDPEERGRFIARLSPSAELLGTRRLSAEETGVDLALASSGDSVLALFEGGPGSDATGRIDRVLLDPGLEHQVVGSIPAEGMIHGLRAAWNGRYFVAAWSTNQNADDIESWATAIDREGRSSPAKSITEGFGGYLYGLAVHRERTIVFHSSKKLDPTRIAATELGCGLRPPKAPTLERCGLVRWAIDLPRMERADDALWGLSGVKDGWVLVQAQPDPKGSQLSAWRIASSGQATQPTLVPNLPIAHSLQITSRRDGVTLAWRDFEQQVWSMSLDPGGTATSKPFQLSQGETWDFGAPCLGINNADTLFAWGAGPAANGPARLQRAQVQGSGPPRRDPELKVAEGPIGCAFFPDERGLRLATFETGPDHTVMRWSAPDSTTSLPPRLKPTPYDSVLPTPWIGELRGAVWLPRREFGNRGRAVWALALDRMGRVRGAQALIEPSPGGGGFLTVGLATRGSRVEVAAFDGTHLVIRDLCLDEFPEVQAQ